MKTDLVNFINNFARRRTKNQKNRFRSYIKSIATQFNFEYFEESFNVDRKKGTNILVGNVHTADYVFVTSYDTHEDMGSNDKFYYYDQNKVTLKYLKRNLIFNIMKSTMVFILALLIVKMFSSKENVMTALLYYLGLVLAFFSIYFVKGRDSKYNTIQNCSILLLVEQMKSKKNNFAFIFLDQNAYINLGFAYFLENNNLRNKSVIEIVNLSAGNDLRVYHNNKSKSPLIIRIENEIKDVNLLNLNNEFIKTKTREFISIVLGIEDEVGFYCPNYSTNQDIVYNEQIFITFDNILKTL